MIKIIKTEYASEFSPIVRSVHFKDADFFDFTDASLTGKDFAKSFCEHVSEFGEVTNIHEDRKYISVSYNRFNRGVLEIYPEPPPVPEKKRPTKNLESLVTLANSKGLHVSIDQSKKEFNFSWSAWVYNESSEVVGHSYWNVTAYQAVKKALKIAGLKLYADTEG